MGEQQNSLLGHNSVFLHFHKRIHGRSKLHQCACCVKQEAKKNIYIYLCEEEQQYKTDNQLNCVNNKMVEHDWLLTVLICNGNRTQCSPIRVHMSY